MKIKSIKWRNIFSYGNREVSLDFDDEGTLWQLTGVSGAGKTSLLSIPKLLFFGKTEDDHGKPISVNDIANWTNKKGWIRGEVISGNNTYVIERTFSPSSLSVWKNGEQIDRAGKKDMQNIIDTEILKGMPYHIFTNLMTLSLNGGKSFISMTPSDKREIIDKIFSLEIINKIYEYIKRDKKELGISAVRGGTIVGEHEVIFAGIDEVIEIKHTAYSKSVFAKGAVEAAKFLAGKPAGIYDMSDVINS